MYDFKQRASLFNHVLLMTDEEQKQPIASVQHFFQDYQLYEVRQHLCHLFEVAITSENDLYAEAGERNKLFAFHQQVEKLIEAAYLLQIGEK